MTQALSTVVNTPFAERLYAEDSALLYPDAQQLADANGAPVGVWKRGPWLCLCETAPELIEPQPELDGWELWAVVDPSEVTVCEECDGTGTITLDASCGALAGCIGICAACDEGGRS